MDWQRAISRNRDALLRIMAALFALAGLTAHLGAPVSCLPHKDGALSFGRGATLMSRHLHSTILRILRPAESAVRRLIMIAARGLNFGDSLLNFSNASGFKAQGWIELRKLSSKFSTRVPSFCLFDPLKRVAPFAEHADDDADFWNPEDKEAEDETAFIRTFPRISVPGLYNPVFTPPTLKHPDGLINARHLICRLLALKSALDNLPRHARRLARWQAKRNLLRQQFPFRPLRLSPFRPGLPPGFRIRQREEVDDILKECQGLVMDLLAIDSS
jgi:hypothetical protein